MFRLRDNNKNSHGISKNISLSLMRVISNILIPIATIPYISRVLGVESFGLVNFYMAIISVAMVVTSLGLTTFAVKEIHKDNSHVLNEKIALSIVYVRIIILMLFTSVLFLFSFFEEKFNYVFILCLFLTVLGEILCCDWFFSAMRRQYILLISNLVSKLIFLVGTYFFIKNESDSMNYLILYSLSWFLVGVYVFTRIFKFDINYKSLGFYRLPYMEVIFIFGVMLLSSIFGKFDLLVIGNVLDANEYGYFSAAYKLVTIMLTIVTSISIVVLPFFSKEVNNLSSSNNFLMNMILYVSLFIFSFLISYSEPIIFIVFGSDYSESIEYLQYLGILLLLVPFYNSVIYQVLIPRKDYKSIFIIFFVSILAALSVFASGDEISNNMVFYIVSCNLFLFLFFAIKSYMFGFKVIIKRELIFCILCFFGMSFLSDNLSIEEMTQFYLGVGVYSILFLLFSYSIFRRNR